MTLLDTFFYPHHFYYVESAPRRSYRYLAASSGSAHTRKYPGSCWWTRTHVYSQRRRKTRPYASGNGLCMETTPPGVAILKFLKLFNLSGAQLNINNEISHRATCFSSPRDTSTAARYTCDDLARPYRHHARSYPCCLFIFHVRVRVGEYSQTLQSKMLLTGS